MQICAIGEETSKIGDSSMQYQSTRNDTAFVDSAQAVLNGLAPDGGLYVPVQLPALDVQAEVFMI